MLLSETDLKSFFSQDIQEKAKSKRPREATVKRLPEIPLHLLKEREPFLLELQHTNQFRVAVSFNNIH